MGAHVIHVGIGNVGSHSAELVARMPAVSRMTLVDDGTYERKNLVGQRIEHDDVGGRKVDVQAKRLRRIRPDLEIVAIPERVEDVPLGRLRGDVIVAGVDSRRSRQTVNEIARRLGLRWIDGAVQAADMLARVNVYEPAESSPCQECEWADRDYDGLEQVKPCLPDAEAPPTNAPASLGALVASLQAIECERLLNGEASALDGRQVFLDVRHHQHHVTSFRRNPKCRLADHGPWEIEALDFGAGDPTLGELAGEDAATLEIFGRRFVRELVCPECAHRVRTLRVAGSLRATDRRCPRCPGHEDMVPSGFHTFDELDVRSLDDAERGLPVREIGVRSGDVIGLTPASGAPRRLEVTLTNHCDGGNSR